MCIHGLLSTLTIGCRGNPSLRNGLNKTLKRCHYDYSLNAGNLSLEEVNLPLYGSNLETFIICKVVYQTRIMTKSHTGLQLPSSAVVQSGFRLVTPITKLLETSVA